MQLHVHNIIYDIRQKASGTVVLISSYTFCNWLILGLAQPPPPIVGKVTHYSIELYWEEALAKANAEGKSKKKKGDNRIQVCVQEKDSHGVWGNVYS